MNPVSEIANLDFFSSLLTLIIGFTLILAGKLIVKTIVSLLFGTGVSYLTYMILSLANVSIPTILFISVVVFIIGYLIGWFLIKLSISIITGFALGIILIYTLDLQSSVLYSSLVIIISIALCYFLVEKTISVITALLGLTLILIGFMNITHNQVLTIALTVFTLIIALYIKTKLR